MTMRHSRGAAALDNTGRNGGREEIHYRRLVEEAPEAVMVLSPDHVVR